MARTRLVYRSVLLYLADAEAGPSADLPAFNWNFGVYLASTMGSETTAAAFGEAGKSEGVILLPCCRFAVTHMAEYFNHWLQFGRDLPNAPRDIWGQLVPQKMRKVSFCGRLQS